MIRRLTNFFGKVIQFGCMSHCFFQYVADIVVCSGPSMQPTLQSNNVLITNVLVKGYGNYKRGDIIIAVSPTNPKQFICKRIVGIPGDKIIVPTKTHDGCKKEEIEYVPKGYIWVEGDNKQNSSDSRTYGPIPLGLVKSRVILRAWPLKDIKFFNDGNEVLCDSSKN